MSASDRALVDAIRARVREILDRPQDLEADFAIGEPMGPPGARTLVALATDPASGARLLIQAAESEGRVELGDVILHAPQVEWLRRQLDGGL